MSFHPWPREISSFWSFALENYKKAELLLLLDFANDTKRKQSRSAEQKELIIESYSC